MALVPFSRFWMTNRLAEGGTERFVEWSPPHFGPVPDRVYVVTQAVVNRIDLISQAVYGTVELWWVILYFNHLADPFSLRPGDRLHIPDFQQVSLILSKMRSTGSRVIREPGDPPVRVIQFRQPDIHPYVRPRPATTSTRATAAQIQGFNIGFNVPAGFAGALHFQLQVSLQSDFSSLVMSRITYSSQANWFFYNPFLNSQAGGWQTFPAEGLDGSIYEGQTVYYHVSGSDPLVQGNQYFLRYRTWYLENEGIWNVPPPFLY